MAAIGLALAPLLGPMLMPPPSPPNPLDVLLPVMLIGGGAVVFLVVAKKQNVLSGTMRSTQGGLLSPNS